MDVSSAISKHRERNQGYSPHLVKVTLATVTEHANHRAVTVLAGRSGKERHHATFRVRCCGGGNAIHADLISDPGRCGARGGRATDRRCRRRRWKVNNRVVAIGVGLLTGNSLAVSYYGNANGVALYTIDDNRLIGHWTQPGAHGAVFTETLTRITQDELHAPSTPPTEPAPFELSGRPAGR